MNPIRKLKEILRSIDQQLRDIRERASQQANEWEQRSQGFDHQIIELQQSIQAQAAELEHLKMQFEEENTQIQLHAAELEHLNTQMAEEHQWIQKQISELLQAQNQSMDLLQNMKQQMEMLQNQNSVEHQNVEQQLSEQQRTLKDHQADQLNDHWMTKFGFDNLIAMLQLAQVEQQIPGNRACLEALRHTHTGETCFVIGNGPSLKAADLTVLKEKGIFCFASKRITAIFPETPWRPDVWGVSDLGFIQLYHEEMDSLEGFLKLVPCQSLLTLNIPIHDAIYFPFIQAERTPCWFNEDVTRGVHFWGTITAKLINFAVYMGFTKIYLLGVDHSWPTVKDRNGNIRYDTSVPAHFSEKYYDSEADYKKAVADVENAIQSYVYMTQGFRAIKYHCDRMGVEIFNATRGGKLEVFPRVDFDAWKDSFAQDPKDV